MENSSLSSDVINVTQSSIEDDGIIPNMFFAVDLALKVIYIIIGIVGVLDNLFVVVVFIFFIKVADKAMSILIVNQSLIDICASFFGLLLSQDVKMTGLSQDSAYDQFVCRFWLTRKPLWCMLVTSTYGTVIMTLSRYIAVIYPIRYKILNAKKHIVYGALAFICIVIPTLEILFTAVTTDIIQGTCLAFGVYQNYAMQKSIGFFTVFIAYLLPLALMVFCYARIVHALRTKMFPIESAATSKSSRNATMTSMTVCCGYVLCWSSNEIMFFLRFIGCINPFIYAAKYGEFKKGVRRMMARLIRRAPEIQPQQNSGGIGMVSDPIHQHTLDTGVT